MVIIFLWLSSSCRGLQQKLHRLALPLVGGPPWLRLHEAAVFEDAESGSLLLLDFLPAAPEAIETAIDLLTLGTVEGVVRTKAVGTNHWRRSRRPVTATWRPWPAAWKRPTTGDSR